MLAVIESILVGAIIVLAIWRLAVAFGPKRRSGSACSSGCACGKPKASSKGLTERS